MCAAGSWMCNNNKWDSRKSLQGTKSENKFSLLIIFQYTQLEKISRCTIRASYEEHVTSSKKE